MSNLRTPALKRGGHTMGVFFRSISKWRWARSLACLGQLRVLASDCLVAVHLLILREVVRQLDFFQRPMEALLLDRWRAQRIPPVRPQVRSRAPATRLAKRRERAPQRV